MLVDNTRLVLIRCICKSDSGEDSYNYGTGYFITKSLVLTAMHILPSKESKIEIRLESPSGRKDPWLRGSIMPVWMSPKLDALLLNVDDPISEVTIPTWGVASSREETWYSSAYPSAAAEQTEEGIAIKSSSLGGILYTQGGGGQGSELLELGVDYESEKGWKGISGAPIFVGDEFVGIIKSFAPGFNGKRLYGVPIIQLLKDPEFQDSIKPKLLPTIPQRFSILILISENGDEEFSDKVKSAIQRQVENISRLENFPPETKPFFINVSVNQILENPARWYEIVEAICKVRIMIVDVTNYQPAIMVLLGIRAVARRGVTITVSTKERDESSLTELPFNIQETKLIYFKRGLEINNPFHLINRIGEAVVKGLTQLKEHPGYLDLPAYDAVRCLKPQIPLSKFNTSGKGNNDADLNDSVIKNTESDRILMLCSFNNDYRERYWDYVSNMIAYTEGAGRSLERMLDISSPRLVGQALYESIRWTPCCIVDFTHWRPNVFFELGVRLACSGMGPICLIANDENDSLGDGNYPVQKKQLIKLLQPIFYELDGPNSPFKKAFERYDSFLRDSQKDIDYKSAIPHNATYQTVLKAYDWKQETFVRLPHEELRTIVEMQQGKDPQKDGGVQALFSSNPEYQMEIQKNGRERWIAAWYYFRHRYFSQKLESKEFEGNEKLKEQLSVLTERVVQELGGQHDANYKRVYNEARELIDKLDQI